MKEYRKGRGMAPLILILGTKIDLHHDARSEKHKNVLLLSLANVMICGDLSLLDL
jgi:hypothetical protein